MTPSALTSEPVIDYPDSDGMPMADNTLQYEWIVTLKGGLDALFADREDVFVAGDLLWYPIEGDNKTRVAPDVLVAFGRPKGHRGSYKQWEEGGIAPQVVFEVVSPRSQARDQVFKVQFYEDHGVEEYYIYDPDMAVLSVYMRNGPKLREVAFQDRLRSPRLGITFDLSEGELQVFRPNGFRFLTFAELTERDETQSRLINEERRRADEATQRAARLAERLRELGVDPESIP